MPSPAAKAFFLQHFPDFSPDLELRTLNFKLISVKGIILAGGLGTRLYR
jgi:hypothetical protein